MPRKNIAPKTAASVNKPQAQKGLGATVSPASMTERVSLTPDQLAEEEERRETDLWLSQNTDLLLRFLASDAGLPIYPNGVGNCCLKHKPRKPRTRRTDAGKEEVAQESGVTS